MTRRVQYVTEHNTIGEGIVVDEMENSPLTGKHRILIVDFHSEAADPEAGKWIDADQVVPDEDDDDCPKTPDETGADEWWSV